MEPQKQNNGPPVSVPPPFRSPRLDPIAVLSRSFLIGALVLAVAYLLSPYAIALVMGAIFGTALLPLFYGRLRRVFRSKKMRAFTLVTFFFLAVLIPSAAAIYTGVNQIVEIIRENQIDIKAIDVGGEPRQFALRVDRWLQQMPNVNSLLTRAGIERAEVLQTLSDIAVRVQNKILQLGTTMVVSVPELAVSIVILLATMYFFFVDHPRIRSWFFGLRGFNSVEIVKIGNTFSDTCRSVVVASVISGVVQGFIISMGSVITGFGSPLIVGLITFFSSFLPLFGTGVVSLSLITISLITGDWGNFAVFCVTGVLASFADNLVAPIVVGNSAKVHPLVTFVSALGAISMIGFFGLFIGPVLTATLLKSISGSFRKSFF